jgi:geranylgeranyl diphosphate synthase type I
VLKFIQELNQLKWLDFFMDFKSTLSEFKKEIDKEIEIYFDRVIKETKKQDAVITGAVKHVKKLTLSGGKRIRPALMYYGYVGMGGKEKERMLKAAVSIELVHMFLLIHDDVIDRDFERHGVSTINKIYEDLGKKYFPDKDSRHFGNAMALIVGDMIAALGNQIIFESGFKNHLVMKALSKLQSIISYTVVGEVKDFYIGYKGKATEKEVMDMYEYKTAKYTVEGPLHLGAVLGGADEETLKLISGYSIPVGIAFQIQDDILGVFGNEEKLGKKVGSDIEEGKMTVLVTRANQKAGSKERKIMNSILGREGLSFDEIERFRSIIRNSGSLAYAQSIAERSVEKGKQQLAKTKFKKETKDFLYGMADYIIKREV